MLLRTSILSVLLVAFLAFPSEAQRRKKKKQEEAQPATTEKKDNGQKIKPYAQVIKPGAVTDEGLFHVHYVDNKYYFEVPDSLLNKDMLLVSSIAMLPEGLGGGYVTAGSNANEQVVRWEKKQDKILLRSVSYGAVANDSLPIFLSVQANNFQPVIYAFDIAAFGRTHNSYVIDVTKFYSSDVKAISGVSTRMREEYKVSSLDGERSFIDSIKSFPTNIEVQQEMTYNASKPPSNSHTGSISILMNQSMILLPEVPMEPRTYDPRVGWFTIRQIDYGSPELKADEKTYIRRWKLIPKDIEAYKRGELVEPVEPIVYYLDPATPMQWRPYIKQGVEDWQKTFETAGFKNAIIAKDPPSKEEDPEFSPEDARYSTVRYVATTTRNAMGPSVSDPRTGEIIESDIVWYHNHLRSYRNRYLLETGAANPSARTLDTPEKEIGEMLRQVIAHEIGHALGLPHNMKSSSAYPVDSLRSGSFTRKYGIAPSVMDYARYNYVAQPGDEGIRYIRQIGPYDHYSINWGYRYFPEASQAEEKEMLNKLVKEHEGDPVYMFGSDYGIVDPTSQTENIGADPIMASDYGLKNLKAVAPRLNEWTAGETGNYEDLEELYGELLGVWGRYTGHVTAVVGGVVEERKRADQEGFVFSMVDKKTQKDALKWLNNNAFSTPEWLLQENILKNVSSSGNLTDISRVQTRTLNRLLESRRLQRMLEFELYKDQYTPTELLEDVRNGIFSELRNGKEIDIFRRNLQKAYVQQLIEYADYENMKDDLRQTDIPSLAMAALNDVRNDITRTRSRFTGVSRAHLDDLAARIEYLNKK